MSAPDVYRTLIVAFAAPTLKRHGFKSSGPTFFLRRDANWGLINFQQHLARPYQFVTFTINVAVVSGRLRAFFYPEGPASRPTASEGDFQQRIGLLLPEQTDKWWTIDATTALDQLGPELASYLSDLAIPTIEKYITDDALIALWQSGASPGLSEALRQLNLAALLKLRGATGS